MGEIKNNLKSLRLEKELTLSQLSEIIGVSDASLSRYETDIIMPRYDILIKIAEFYNVSIDYIFGRTEYKRYENYDSDEVIVIPRGKYLGAKEEKLIRNFAKDLEKYNKE